MSGVFVLRAENRCFAPRLWFAILGPGDLAIYSLGHPKLIVSRASCEIVDALPETVIGASIGRRLVEIIARELLEPIPGACDARITGARESRNIARSPYEHPLSFMTVFRTTPIDVASASIDHVARCMNHRKCVSYCKDAEAQAEAALIASLSKGR